ncbi:MAG TPA: phospholipase D-like domain-containing protein [Vicinamibacterales bacterium]|nr:phospholipase D-like domain-containing protein [Vicinamibacterales bacterium]
MSSSRPRYYQRRPELLRRQISRQWQRRMLPEITRERERRGWPSVWHIVRRLLWAWWLWAGVAVWALTTTRWGWFYGAVAAAIVTHLGAPREQAPTYGLDHELDLDAREFVDTVVGLTAAPVMGGNRITLLQNGDAFYPAMLGAIRGAKQSITIEAYIYWNGRIGLEFATALAERASAGVEVKILLDAVGSASIGREILTTLEQGGCELAWYNPIRWQTLGLINYRTHRKTLLIDGLVGFTGGAGIADHWCGHAEDPDHWRDTQIRIEGPAVVPLQTGFAQNWLQATGEVVTGPSYFPDVRGVGDIRVQTMLSSPSTGTSPARLLHYLLITCAREEILVANPYFIPDHAAIEAFGGATRRGVTVKVMVAGKYNDTWLARQNSVRIYGRLLDAGVEVYEYTRTMLHQKTMVVDRTWATIGTTNFDNRSFSFNQENNVSFADRELVDQLVRAFDEDLCGCERITRETWERRGLIRKAIEFGASVFKEQA